MNKNLKWFGLGGAIVTAMLFAMNLPAADPSFAGSSQSGLYDNLLKSCMNTAKRDCETWAREGGGSEAPRGLTVNTKVELANGERYILSGVIQSMGPDLYLRIDLRSFPWLASRTRVANPFYRISDDMMEWKKYLGKNVTILANAKYALFNRNGQTLFEVVLVPAPESVIDALQRR